MYLDLQTQRHEFCLLSRWTPPALHSCIKSGSHTHPNRDTEVQWRKKKGKKERWRGEKNLDPCCGLCVGTGEQFVLQNSHYQHSAAGLQLAGAEGSVA